MDMEEIKKIANRSLIEYLENEKEKFQENIDEQQNYKEAEKARIALFGNDYEYEVFEENNNDITKYSSGDGEHAIEQLQRQLSKNREHLYSSNI